MRDLRRRHLSAALVAAVTVILGWPAATLWSQTSPQEVTRPTFEAWLAGVRAEAKSRGVSDATFDAAFAGVVPDPVVIARDRTQPEHVQSLDEYVAARLTERNITTARAKAVEHKALALKVEAAYGIPPDLMIAIWGAESNFGQFTGTRPVITSIATLAYDTRRPALFRGELLEALTILEKGLVEPSQFLGSWAGAIGQPQFMPSSFLRHAVDFDQDGRIDIWTNPADVLGSMANYMKNAGWTGSERWGREVKASREAVARIEKAVPMRSTGCGARRAMTEARALSEWTGLGVTNLDDSPLPTADIKASLVRGPVRHFLVYKNYDALLEYNCSNSYAIGIGLMADRIAAK